MPEPRILLWNVASPLRTVTRWLQGPGAVPLIASCGGRAGWVRACGEGESVPPLPPDTRGRQQMSVRNQRPIYGALPYTPLLPWQVRERRFNLVGLGRRGLEPDHVYA